MLHETYQCNAFVRSCHLDRAEDERLIIPALQKSMVWCVLLVNKERSLFVQGSIRQVFECKCAWVSVFTWDEVGDGQAGTSFTAVAWALVAGGKQDVTVPPANLRPWWVTGGPFGPIRPALCTWQQQAQIRCKKWCRGEGMWRRLFLSIHPSIHPSSKCFCNANSHPHTLSLSHKLDPLQWV